MAAAHHAAEWVTLTERMGTPSSLVDQAAGEKAVWQIELGPAVIGRPAVLLPTPCHVSDVTTTPALLIESRGRFRRPRADKGYDADWPCIDLRRNGMTPIILGKRGHQRRIRHDRPLSQERWRIEAAFSPLKDFRRIATRSDELARNSASTLALVAAAFWCRSSSERE